MSRKTNTLLIGLLGTILMALSTWVIITLVELQVLVMMIQQELMDLDKVIGRIYSHMDRLSQRWKKNCKQCKKEFEAKDEFDMFCSQDCKEEALADLDKDSDECLSCQ